MHLTARLGQSVGLIAALLLLTDCRFSHRPNPAVLSRLVVVADEPVAAEIGRRVLTERGNAADAAVAMALAMTVTLPSRVGLGGGGVCLAHDPRDGSVQVIDALPRAAAGEGAGGAAMPGLLRGLAALHGSLGSQRWAALVAEAESLARFGVPVSRPLARDLAGGGGGLPGHGALREGETLVQPRLAESLAEIRTGGGNAFYNGALGRRYAEAATAAGFALPVEAVRAFQPRRPDPLRVEVAYDGLFFAPQPELNGPSLAALWTALQTAGAAPAGGAGGVAMPERAAVPFSAGLAVMSQDEMAVVCGFTMNGRFGTGRVAGDTGIMIAPAPAPGAPMHGGLTLLVNQPRQQFLYAGSGAEAASALLMPLVAVVGREQPLSEALAAPRPAPEGIGAAIHCIWDRAAEKRCFGAADPRGGGAAFSLEQE